MDNHTVPEVSKDPIISMKRLRSEQNQSYALQHKSRYSILMSVNTTYPTLHQLQKFLFNLITRVQKMNKNASTGN